VIPAKNAPIAKIVKVAFPAKNAKIASVAKTAKIASTAAIATDWSEPSEREIML
jgi:hypothetical protein